MPTYARTRMREHTHTAVAIAVQVSAIHRRPLVAVRSLAFIARSRVIEINNTR